MAPNLGSFRGWLIFTVVALIVESIIRYGYVVGTGNVLEHLRDHGMLITPEMAKLTDAQLYTMLALIMLLGGVFLCVWPILAESQKRRGFLIPWAILLMICVLVYFIPMIGSIIKHEGLEVLWNVVHLAFFVFTLVVTFYRYKELKMESGGARRGPEMGAMGGVPVMFVNKK